MASSIVGRFSCLCGFAAAHVKKSDKCLYHYCPACGMNGPHAKTDAQKQNMLRAMRPEPEASPAASKPISVTPAAAATEKPAEKLPTPTGEITDTPAPKRRGLFS